MHLDIIGGHFHCWSFLLCKFKLKDDLGFANFRLNLERLFGVLVPTLRTCVTVCVSLHVCNLSNILVGWFPAAFTFMSTGCLMTYPVRFQIVISTTLIISGNTGSSSPNIQ